MMRSKNLLAALLGFLLVVIAAYFGSSIYNAKSNDPIRYLDEMDHIYHYDVELIPQLNQTAALVTLPLIAFILILQIIIILKAKPKVVRNIGIGLLVAVLVVLIVDLLILSNPPAYDFSKWGYIWMTMGIFIVAGNVISAFVKGNAVKKS